MPFKKEYEVRSYFSSYYSKLVEADRLAVGITDGMVRLSIGLEHFEDIKNDLAQALDKI